PQLHADGYDGLGIDPAAPAGDFYRRVEFERSDPPSDVDAVIASTSLHHVADPGEVLDGVASALAPGGLVVVVEWEWEGFDETTARWCFERLGHESGSWLEHRRDEWTASGQTWERYVHGWAERHGLHSTRRVLRDLDQRFERLRCDRGPYFFSELSRT